MTDDQKPTEKGTGGEELFSFHPLDTISKKKRSRKLESMKCWPEVKHMLDNGIPVRDIVHFIQNVKKEYTSVKSESLRGVIQQWLGKLENRNKLIDHRIPVRHLNLIASNQDRIDPIDGLNVLYAIQFDRALTGYQKEIESGVQNPETASNLRLCKEMLTGLAEMQGDIVKLKHKTGPNGSGNGSPERGMDSHLAQMDRIKKIYEERHGPTAAGVMIDPESRRKIFLTLNKVRRTNGDKMKDLLDQNSETAREHQVIDVEHVEDVS